MRIASSIATAVLATVAALPAAQAAGVVNVSFVDTDRYVDAGTSASSIKRTTEALGEHLRSLASKLPDGQVLTVRVTDIDLAGEIHPNRSRGDLRVLRGRADWPRIDLSYTLQEGGRTLQSGDVKLSDMAYLQQFMAIDHGQEFAYERRMLTRWVGDLVAGRAAP